MKSRAPPRFWAAYRELPREIREAAQKAYRLFRHDPNHPSLRFKKVHDREPIYPVRVTAAYRVVGLLEKDEECYAGLMTIRARVRGGRLVVDEPTTLPEGTELELLPLDPGDCLDDADRAALHAALAQSQADVDAGRLVDAANILNRLRSS